MAPGGKTPDRPVDRVYEQLPARYPGVVEFFDYEAVLRGPNGDWPRTITELDGSTVLLRKPDEWHMCPEGAERVAEAVLSHTAEIRWTPPTAIDWQDGDWRSNERYDDPKGGCVV
jgi:hypothetical protein